MFVDLIGEQAALVKAHIARRRADQTRDRVAFHVFGHVVAQQFDAQRISQLFAELGFPHPGRPGQQERADGLFGIAQPRTRHLDGGGQAFDSLILAEHHHLQVAFQVLHGIPVRAGDRLRRDTRDLCHDSLDVLHPDGFFAPGRGQQLLRGPGLVDDVDSLVRQVAVGDVTLRQFRRRAQRLLCVTYAVVLLKARFQALQDLDGLVDGRFDHIDLLEAPRQRAVFLEDTAKLLVGGGTDALDGAGGQRRLDDIGRIHDRPGGGAGADDGMDLVDEQNCAVFFHQLGNHAFQALLEIAAIAGPGQQRAHVQ